MKQHILLLIFLACSFSPLNSAGLETVATEGQPLGAQVRRLARAMHLLGKPFPEELESSVVSAARARDVVRIQQLLDPHVLIEISINPEERVKARRGPAPATLHQAGYTPVLLKIVNLSTSTRQLRITSPQAGPVYSGTSAFSLKRQAQ